MGSHFCICCSAVSAADRVPRGFSAAYLVVDVVSAHGDGVHDKLPAVVVAGSAGGDVVGVVLRAEIVAQLVSGHQIGLLGQRNNNTHIMNCETPDQCWICEKKTTKKKKNRENPELPLRSLQWSESKSCTKQLVTHCRDQNRRTPSVSPPRGSADFLKTNNRPDGMVHNTTEGTQ